MTPDKFALEEFGRTHEDVMDDGRNSHEYLTDMREMLTREIGCIEAAEATAETYGYTDPIAFIENNLNTIARIDAALK